MPRRRRWCAPAPRRGCWGQRERLRLLGRPRSLKLRQWTKSSSCSRRTPKALCPRHIRPVPTFRPGSAARPQARPGSASLTSRLHFVFPTALRLQRCRLKRLCEPIASMRTFEDSSDSCRDGCPQHDSHREYAGLGDLRHLVHRPKSGLGGPAGSAQGAGRGRSVGRTVPAACSAERRK